MRAQTKALGWCNSSEEAIIGFGDAILATRLARGLHAIGRLAAFGNVQNRRIKWTGYCEDVFKNNPNIARPGMERLKRLVWFPHYKGKVPYCRYDGYSSLVWNYGFKVKPGEMFLDPVDRTSLPDRFIVVEPNVAWHRLVACNKDWGEGKYEELARKLMTAGYSVVQCVHSTSQRKIPDANHINTSTFHQAIGIMSQASLIIAPEGANHHAAAAINVPAIIVWGGWSPPQTMGYDNHINLTGGATKACGSTIPCPHCRQAFDNITVEDVYQAAIKVVQ